MAVKMMLGLLSVICIINFILMNKQTDTLADRDMEIKALIEMNQKEIRDLGENQDAFFEKTNLELNSLKIKLSKHHPNQSDTKKSSADKFKSLKNIPATSTNG